MADDREAGIVPENLASQPKDSQAESIPLKKVPESVVFTEDTGDPDIVYSIEIEHVLNGNRPSASGAVTSGQKLP